MVDSLVGKKIDFFSFIIWKICWTVESQKFSNWWREFANTQLSSHLRQGWSSPPPLLTYNILSPPFVAPISIIVPCLFFNLNAIFTLWIPDKKNLISKSYHAFLWARAISIVMQKLPASFLSNIHLNVLWTQLSL